MIPHAILMYLPEKKVAMVKNLKTLLIFTFDFIKLVH